MSRNVRRTAALIATVLAAVMVLAVPASAQTDSDSSYAGGGGISTPTPNPVVSSQVTINGFGCNPGSTVTVTVNPTYTVIADANGEFSLVITAPSTPGPATVTAVCGDNSYALTLNVRAATPASLATTGTDSLPLARLGLVLVAVGALAVIAARRSRRDTRISVDS